MIILEYNLEEEDDFFFNLTSLYNDFISSRKKLLKNLKHSSGNQESIDSRVGDPAPLLILLSIDFAASSVCYPDTPDITDHSDMSEDEDQEEQQRIVIMTAVARTHEFLKNIIDKDSASSASLGWYVQPFEKKSSLEGPLKNGLYPGIFQFHSSSGAKLKNYKNTFLNNIQVSIGLSGR